MNVSVDINNLLPRDCRKTYDPAQDIIKKRIPSPAVLVTYAAGSNIGSIHLLWITDDEQTSSRLHLHQVSN